MNPVPELRIRVVNTDEVMRERDYVLYWTTSNRRTGWNFALDRALAWARELDRPLVVLDALRAGYRWASDRLHAFVLQGIGDNASVYAKRGVQHYTYVEPKIGAGRGLLAALAKRACVVVGDDYPCFMLPRMSAAGAKQVGVRMELVDSNGILPLRTTRDVFPTAYAFRRFLQGNLSEHLAHFPAANPLGRTRRKDIVEIDSRIERKWPRATMSMLAASRPELARLPIDHAVAPVELRGGQVAGTTQLKEFLDRRLIDYEEQRSEPDADASSGLSPYLHFGMVSIHQIFAALAEREEWSPKHVSSKTRGSRAGWWGMSTMAESFLDEAITWRELGLNFTSKRADYDRYESLPPWARQTLEQHASDLRPHVYGLAQFESAATHDPLWNAAQRELLSTGKMHNYLRMLWGKKILEWSATPRAALDVMIELNNKYALDGRDPNSYSGIFWCLGRYDRPWGPERAIFGKVRCMTSQNTARKFSVDGYLKRFGKEAAKPFIREPRTG